MLIWMLPPILYGVASLINTIPRVNNRIKITHWIRILNSCLQIGIFTVVALSPSSYKHLSSYSLGLALCTYGSFYVLETQMMQIVRLIVGYVSGMSLWKQCGIFLVVPSFLFTILYPDNNTIGLQVVAGIRVAFYITKLALDIYGGQESVVDFEDSINKIITKCLY
jgi:hypothetical protein